MDEKGDTKDMKSDQTRKRVTMGILIALAYASLYVIRVPIIPTATFLRFDVKDVFIAIGGLMFGASYALVGSVCVSVLQMLLVSEYGVIGMIMNILSVSAFTVPISYVYKREKNTRGLIGGLVLGCVSMVAAMLLWNYLITPLYMGVSREIIIGMLLPAFFPFNLVKSVINASIIFLVFQRMKKTIILDFYK